MHIGLVHVDGKLPNLALMKLSAYHKAKGDTVTLYHPADVISGDHIIAPWHKLYAAVIFEKSRRIAELLADCGAEMGGTGWDLTTCLPPEIETMRPDYDLYGIHYGLGFTSRGCIRNCPFCVVPRKEGRIRHVASPGEILNPKSKELVLLDNNFLADPHWRESAIEIIDNGYKVDFTQGLDIRLVDREAAEYIAAMKHLKRIHFAFDHIGLAAEVRAGVDLLLQQGIHPDRLSFYILTNFNSTFEEDRRRIAILDEYGANSFVMVYDKPNASNDLKNLQLWCNKYQTKKSCRFEDFDRKAYRAMQRRQKRMANTVPQLELFTTG